MIGLQYKNIQENYTKYILDLINYNEFYAILKVNFKKQGVRMAQHDNFGYPVRVTVQPEIDKNGDILITFYYHDGKYSNKLLISALLFISPKKILEMIEADISNTVQRTLRKKERDWFDANVKYTSYHEFLKLIENYDN